MGGAAGGGAAVNLGDDRKEHPLDWAEIAVDIIPQIRSRYTDAVTKVCVF